MARRDAFKRCEREKYQDRGQTTHFQKERKKKSNIIPATIESIWATTSATLNCPLRGHSALPNCKVAL